MIKVNTKNESTVCIEQINVNFSEGWFWYMFLIKAQHDVFVLTCTCYVVAPNLPYRWKFLRDEIFTNFMSNMAFAKI